MPLELGSVALMSATLRLRQRRVSTSVPVRASYRTKRQKSTGRGPMRFSRLHVTAALLALASPAAAQKEPTKGCELVPQYDALVSARTKLGNSFKERGKVILAQKPISRDDVILMNAFRD